VDSAQAAVTRDQAALNAASELSTSQAIACAVNAAPTINDGTTTTIPGCPSSSAVSNLQAKLKADQFKLQVAQDQLKKDEG
jgi:hypothetical protein